MRRWAILLGWGAIVLALPAITSGEEDARPWTEQPFLGLSVRDTPSGLVVGWVLPGPLGGTGFESALGIQRGDNLVSVDGEAVDVAGFKALIRAKSPGETVVLVYRRSPDAKVDTGVPHGGEGGKETSLEVKLGTRAEWAGTIGRGLTNRTIPDPQEGAFEALLLEKAGELGIRSGDEGVGGGLDALLPYLAEIQEKALDPNSLPAVVQCFRRPLSVDAVEAQIAELARAAATGDLSAVEAFVCAVLDIPPEEDERTPEEAQEAVRFAGQMLEKYQGPENRREPAEALLRTLRTSVYIYDEHAESHVKTISTMAGSDVEIDLILPLTLLPLAPAAWEAYAATLAREEPLTDVPDEVRSVVSGDILWCGEDLLGNLAVVGGKGANEYDMTRMAAVYDVGGDDAYVYGRSSDPVGMRIVIDLAGDDVHASDVDFEGPGHGGLGLLVRGRPGGRRRLPVDEALRHRRGALRHRRAARPEGRRRLREPRRGLRLGDGRRLLRRRA